MATAISLPPDTRPRPPMPIHQFTVEEYHRMIEAGILTEDDRVELLEGWIVPKMARNPPHDSTLSVVHNRLLRRLPDGWVVRNQSAVTIGRNNEPEPDLAVVRGPAERYYHAHPAPRDVVLVIEISDSSLVQDRTVKLPIYARARIPVYWVVNLIEGQVEVYTLPRAGRSPSYRQQEIFAPGDSVPAVIADRRVELIPVVELLPGAGS
jgi:Uma2 family endonuclease